MGVFINNGDNHCSIRIIGSRIKKQRKHFKISQKQLAVGVCTQGLISQIENSNITTNIDVIYKICDRLNLNINDIIVNGIANKTLDQIEDSIFNRQFQQAQQLIIKVKPNNLDTRELKGRYYCYLGVLSLKLKFDYQSAIEAFKEVLIKYSGLDKQNIYTTWAHIGIAKAHLMLKDRNQADQFNELAIAYLKLHQFSPKNDFRLLVNIYLESIALHQELLKYDEAMILNKTACRFLRSVDSMYQLATLNLMMARSLIASNSHQQAVSYLDRAHHLGEFYNDYQIVEQVSKLRNLVQ
ncbi:helix-turn-helix transcriptional regulator [Lactobacillus sp. Sy-1]|uniref:helix-turn-helix domain-containing protein n=1 Tax=Lactobacillus sp. Sy-1 TaxID=2109645 RepID=UPI001C58ED34|nr:helix-turn-helix transcriptional regulator [Lactobacillus sp. Sy-1]MBW1605820.1 helix-turn-helix transcriptional regulator [Lactobacillus sp. Sy-1]